MRNYRSKTPEIELARRRKISQTMKGKSPSNLFYLHSIPYTEERKRKIGLAHKGMKHTEETKRKISETKRDPLRPLYRAVRECYKSRQWRVDIFQRDNYTCVLCRKRGGTLNADHFPKRFVDIIKDNSIKNMNEAIECKELWNIEYGRTLCLKCHNQTETWGNKFTRLKK